jgi:hypothetical protein
MQRHDATTPAVRKSDAPMCQMTITLLPPSVAATERFFRESSLRSRRNRFHGAMSRLPQTEIDGLTKVRDDRLNVYGYDASTGDLLGVASAIFWTADIAEVAVWVLDRCQRHGLGTALACRLRTRLAETNVAHVHALIETSNTAAMALWSTIFPEGPVTPGRLDSEIWACADLAPRMSSTPKQASRYST